MMALVEAFAQQAAATNEALGEAKVELNSKIAKLQKENQVLKDAQRATYDSFNPKMEENKLNDDANHQEVEQPKQKTPVHHLAEKVAPTLVRSEIHSQKQREMKFEVPKD